MQGHHLITCMRTPVVDLHDCDRDRARDHVILDGMEDAQRHSCKWDWPNGIGNN